MRQVRGVLFLDYVRMLRAQKAAQLGPFLDEADAHYLTSQIDRDGWYPMEVFEKLGCAILALIAGGDQFPVQLWGRYSAGLLLREYPSLLEPGQPIETLHRFRVLRETFFDFPAVTVRSAHDGEAQIVINYRMGAIAEEAASSQTLGFFEGLLELAGAREIHGEFRERAWVGAPRTLLVIRWTDSHTDPARAP